MVGGPTMSIYYDPMGLLSQRTNFNFIIGNRGGGKTFGFKKICINRFKKKKQQFVWVRRYQTEIDTLSEFWADISPFFPSDTLTREGDKLYINGELAGYLVALSTSMKLKSVAFPNVSTIIFDEFIIDKGRMAYLRNEAQLFLELYETIARLRDNVQAIFVGNAISITNPYFTYFKIKPLLDQRFTKKNGVTIEFYFNEEFIAQKVNTKFGQLIKDTDYGAYNMRNKFLRDSDSFICERPTTADFKVYQFIIDKEKFSMWRDKRTLKYYVDNSYEQNFGMYRTFVLDPNDMDEKDMSHMLLKRTDQRIKKIKELMEQGDLFYNSQSSKQKFFEILF